MDEVGSLLAARERRVLERPRSAAVLIPVVDDGGPLRIILTRRTDGLPTHKGQVAFPGGGVDPGDGGPVGAALREAEEEIGLPRENVEVLGLLDDFPTVNDEMTVTPVVSRVRSIPALRPAPEEVARIFFIPLDSLQQPERWVTRMVERYGRDWPLYFFEHDGETLWGLSAYMVLHFLDACGLGPPFDLPKAEIP